MIKQDSISIAFTIAAFFSSLYWSTGERNFIGVFPAILLVCSIGINVFIGYSFPSDDNMSGGEGGRILIYAGIATMVMWFTGQYVSYHPFGSTVELSGLDAVTFTILMAVAEEQLFRGALINLVMIRLNSPILAMVVSGTTFYIFHFWVYAGNQAALFYVLAAGMALAFVTVKSGRISPAIIAHVINNILAVM